MAAKLPTPPVAAALHPCPPGIKGSPLGNLHRHNVISNQRRFRRSEVWLDSHSEVWYDAGADMLVYLRSVHLTASSFYPPW